MKKQYQYIYIKSAFKKIDRNRKLKSAFFSRKYCIQRPKDLKKEAAEGLLVSASQHSVSSGSWAPSLVSVAEKSRGGQLRREVPPSDWNSLFSELPSRHLIKTPPHNGMFFISFIVFSHTASFQTQNLCADNFCFSPITQNVSQFLERSPIYATTVEKF